MIVLDVQEVVKHVHLLFYVNHVDKDIIYQVLLVVDVMLLIIVLVVIVVLNVLVVNYHII